MKRKLKRFWYDHFTWHGRMASARRKYNAKIKAKGNIFLNDYSGSLIHKGWLEASRHWAR